MPKISWGIGDPIPYWTDYGHKAERFRLLHNVCEDCGEGFHANRPSDLLCEDCALCERYSGIDTVLAAIRANMLNQQPLGERYDKIYPPSAAAEELRRLPHPGPARGADGKMGTRGQSYLPNRVRERLAGQVDSASADVHEVGDTSD